MKIYPVVNCKDFACVAERIEQCLSFEAGEKMIHIDISDGIFTPNSTWNNPEELKEFLSGNFSELVFSVHLMSTDPIGEAARWDGIPVAEFVFPFEALEDPVSAVEFTRSRKISPVLSFGPDTRVESIISVAPLFDKIQVLAVSAGPAGQFLRSGMIERVSELRKIFPSAIIELDGGVIPSVIREAADAGADSAVSGTYIFSSDSPVRAYEELIKASE